jgi:transposase
MSHIFECKFIEGVPQVAVPILRVPGKKKKFICNRLQTQSDSEVLQKIFKVFCTMFGAYLTPSKHKQPHNFQ